MQRNNEANMTPVFVAFSVAVVATNKSNLEKVGKRLNMTTPKMRHTVFFWKASYLVTTAMMANCAPRQPESE